MNKNLRNKYNEKQNTFSDSRNQYKKLFEEFEQNKEIKPNGIYNNIIISEQEINFFYNIFNKSEFMYKIIPDLDTLIKYLKILIY